MMSHLNTKGKGKNYLLSHYRRFYTNFGALTSVVIIIVMLTLVLVQVNTMFSMKQMTF